VKKLLILGFDGATWTLVRPLMEAGKLPNLAGLVDGGVHGPLRSVPNMRSAAAWTSFMTGTNPGKHGVYEFYERVPGEYQVRFVNGSWRRGLAFWEILGDEARLAGGEPRRVGIANVPMTYPAGEVNGFLIAGLDAPGKESKGFTYPPGLIRNIESAVGEYILEPGVTGMMVAGNEAGAEAALLRSIDQRKKAFLHLMQEQPWDLFVAVFRETDTAHHCFWQYLEPEKVGREVAADSPFRQTIDKVYQRLDEALGEILGALPADTVVMVMSDHGFSFRQYGTSCLNGLLERHGLLEFRSSGGGGGGLLKRAYRGVEGLLGRGAKEKLVRLFPKLRDRVQSRLFFSRIDWKKTRAYSDGVMPVVWINLKGRDPDGIVEPGAAYDAVVSEVTEALLAARDVTTGRRVVEAVHHRDAIYEGACVEAAPDLLVEWKDDEPVLGLVPGDGGAAVMPEFPTGEFTVITGEHRPDGIFVMQGPGVRSGEALEGLSIMDIAPTVLFGMGAPVPADVDGRVMMQAFNAEYLEGKTLVKSEELAGDGGRSDYQDDDAETIRDRLRDLGYIE